MSGSYDGRNRSGSSRSYLDAAEDGHPCEAALELRRVLRVREIADDVPADVLDLCISIAWIGKAISRTEKVGDFLSSGVDPNTWQIIAAVGRDRSLAARVLETAMNAKAGTGMAPELAAIRRSEAFKTASDAVRRIVGEATCAAHGRRWLRLGNLCRDLDDVARVPEFRSAAIVDLVSYRSGRGRD